MGLWDTAIAHVLKLQVYTGVTDGKRDVSPRKQVIMDIDEACFGSWRGVTVTNFYVSNTGWRPVKKKK